MTNKLGPERSDSRVVANLNQTQTKPRRPVISPSIFLEHGDEIGRPET